MSETFETVTQNELQHIDSAETSSERDTVLEKFKEGNLLVRVMDPPRITRGAEGLELDTTTWEEELGFMASENGMQHVSTTMIMEGKGIALYHKPFGFLFDAEKAQVEHVAISDSGSSASESGGLRANPTDLKSLDELRQIYKSRVGTEEMNEINVGVKSDAIVGLVIRKGVKSATALAGLEAARKVVKHKLQDVPVYEYDERTGQMNIYEIPDKEQLLAGINPTFREAYERFFTN